MHVTANATQEAHFFMMKTIPVHKFKYSHLRSARID